MYWPLTCRSKFHRLNEDKTEDIKNLYYNDTDYRSSDKYFTIHQRNYTAHEIINESDILFEIANKYAIEAITKTDTTFNEVYTFITDLLKSVRIMLHKLTDDDYKAILLENFNYFKKRLVLITDLSDDEVKQLIESNSQAEDPYSQLLHLYFDLIWSMVEIDDDLSQAIIQLVYLSFKSYMRDKKNMFLCSCNKSVWLKIQLHCDSNKFWNLFNSVMDCYDDEFCIYFTSLIATLQCYDTNGVYVGSNSSRIVDNFDFFNRHWKNLIGNNPDLSNLTNHLKEVENILSNLWLNSANTEFIYSTWDYFYKRLELIEIGGKLLTVKESIQSEGGGSYYCFLKILMRHLGRHPQHWNKFRGRVYTRFSNVKFAKLNGNGIYNLALLFVCLSDVSFDEICEKLLGMLEALPDEKRNSVMVWNVYITLIQLHLKNNKSIDTISRKFMQMVQSASQNRSHYHLISTYVESLNNLASTGRPDLKQSILIGPWIENYSKTCSLTDLNTLLNNLILIIERAIENNVWFDYESNYNEYVLPIIKRLATNNTSCELIATLAALVAINSINCESLVDYLVSELIPPATTLTFLSLLCKRLNVDDLNLFIIKGWFQCSLIGESNSELNQFVYGITNCNSLETFLAKLNKELIKACFNNLDKYLAKNLLQYCDQIYSNMALVFSTSGKLLYNRSSVTCFLSKYIDLLLLPMDVLRGIRPHETILKSIEQTWHLFAYSIHEMSSGDPYLERILKDLIIKYVPHLQNKPSPLIKLMKNEKLISFALIKINSEFFLHGISRSGNENVCKALLTLHNVLENCLDFEGVKLITINSLAAVFEVYMFKNQKVAVVDFIKLLIKTECYKSGELSPIIMKSLLDVTKKHLPFNTSSYFQLVHVLAKIMKTDLRNSVGGIKEEILSVEAKRGQGFDNSLRQGLDKLQKLLSDT